jgi:LysR family transcriptional activator of nhaA
VFRYAEEIFSLGRELSEVLQGKPSRTRLSLQVGVANVVPKLIAYRVLEPALHLPEPVQLMCDERGLVDLLGELAEHRLDLVLSDSPLPSTSATRAYNHLLGECSVCIFGSNRLARKFRRGFPQSLDGAPFLLPTRKSMLRQSLDQWFDAQNVRPELLGEFEDSALLKVFGQAGVGLFPGPSAVERETCQQYHVQSVGRLDAVRQRFYAISVERKLKHPAVKAITHAAQSTLFQ